MKLFKKIQSSSALILCMCVFLQGCAGRAANPVMVHQYGDEQKSCSALEREMLFIQEEINRLIPQTDKTGKNVLLGVTGFFFLVPLFFMDLSKAEQIEINALRQRYNNLVIIAGDKGCAENREQIPDFKDAKAFQAYQERERERLGLTDEK
ncbi:MAG: hypothetical protein KC649_04200 [Candidatus Omnitrophica bacterium]|nr:hypothetical protein [Candidatus Omnitrophota bacterium]